MHPRTSRQLTVDGVDVRVRVRPFTPADPYILFPSVAEYPVYDDHMYGSFQESPVRNAAYRDALAPVVAGRTVLDIGTGRDALWAIQSALLGATRVYAIEQIPAVAEQARAAVAEAGLSETVIVLTGRSDRVVLPEPADVCVSEIIGNIAGAEGVSAIVRDARERLCTPAAVCVPDRCSTMIAAVSLGGPRQYDGLALAAETLPHLAKVFAAVGHPFDIRLCLAGAPADLLMSQRCEVERATFNGDLVGGHPAGSGVDRGELRVTRDADLHGFLLWPRFHCAAGGGIYDALAVRERSWAPVFAPVSARGIPMAADDRICLRFEHTLSDDGVHPDYRLAATLLRDDGPAVDVAWTSPHHAPRFRASEAYRDLFPPARPRPRSDLRAERPRTRSRWPAPRDDIRR